MRNGYSIAVARSQDRSAMGWREDQCSERLLGLPTRGRNETALHSGQTLPEQRWIAGAYARPRPEKEGPGAFRLI